MGNEFLVTVMQLKFLSLTTIQCELYRDTRKKHTMHGFTRKKHGERITRISAMKGKTQGVIISPSTEKLSHSVNT